METIEELTAFVGSATADGARGRLQARGEARAIIRREGVLPADAPPFGETIDTDLAEYALSLLRASMALREAGGVPEVWRRGFALAGNAFEALVQNGSPHEIYRGFYRVTGAASYHLASYSALAFSLMAQGPQAANLSPAEEALARLRGFADFADALPLAINGLAEKVFTTAGVEERCRWRYAAVAAAATEA